MSWTRVLKRVLDLDIERCSNCGGSLKIIAAIEDPPVIVRILAEHTEESSQKESSPPKAHVVETIDPSPAQR